MASWAMIQPMRENDSPHTGVQIRNVLIFMLVILCLYVLKVTYSVALPIAIALFVFVFLNPLLSHLDRLKCPNLLTIVFVMAMLLFVFLAILYFLVLLINNLVAKLPYYAMRIASLDELLSGYLKQFFNEENDFSLLKTLNIDWYSIAMSWLSSISGKFINIFSDALLIYVFILFLLFERKSLVPKMMVAFSRSKSQRIAALMGKMNKQITKYLLVKLIISAITGFLFYVASVATGLDFAIFWGVLAFVMNFVPTIGSIIVTALTIIMAIIQFMPHWSLVIYVAICMISIEMIMGNIIEPRLQGSQLNLSPVAILISLSIWGYIWGVVGMFLAVPLTSILQIVCANIPALRPAAIILSSGRSYIREYQEKMLRPRQRRKEEAKQQRSDDENRGDFVLPEGKNPEAPDV